MRGLRILALLCALSTCFLSLVACDGFPFFTTTTTTTTTCEGEQDPPDNTNKPIFEVKPSGALLAIGDSITYGTKLSGNVNDTYAKKIADTLGYDYENCAKAGSEAYQWYSMLTRKSAPNGNKYTEVGSVNREVLTAYVEDADLIVFTLGTNDLAYTEWRTVKDIKTALLGLIDKMHEINPEATVVLLGSGHIFKYDGKDASDILKANTAQLATELSEALESENYSSFAHFVDVTDIFSEASSFEDVDGNPDYLHPGYSAHAKMAKAVLEHLGVE